MGGQARHHHLILHRRSGDSPGLRSGLLGSARVEGIGRKKKKKMIKLGEVFGYGRVYRQ